MSEKLTFLAFIVAASAFIAGCSNTVKDNTLRAISLTPSVQSVPMVAELEVDEQKVMGQAKGKTQSESELKKEAIAEALRPVNGDVLVGATFFYEVVDKTNLTVTVLGYPAHYKNFKPKDICEAKEDVLIDGNFYYEDGSKNNISVKIKNPSKSEAAAAVAPILQRLQVAPIAQNPKPAANSPVAPAAPVVHAAPAVAAPVAPMAAPAVPVIVPEAVPATPVTPPPALPAANNKSKK